MMGHPSRLLARFAILCAAFLIAFQTGRAHELQPTISDLRQDGDQIVMTFRMNAEALLSGINLDGLADTGDAADDGAYDTLRALSDEDIEARTPELLPTWNAVPMVRSGEERVPLSMKAVEVEPQSNCRASRFSQ